MIKETYERLTMNVTQFDVEDVITTSGITSGSDVELPSDPYEDFAPI